MGADSSKDSAEKPWDMPTISTLHDSIFEPNIPSVRLDPRVVENAFSSQELDPLTADVRSNAVEHENYQGDQLRAKQDVIAVEHTRQNQDVIPPHEGKPAEPGLAQTNESNSERESERSWMNERTDGTQQYAMRRNEHGKLVPIIDFHGKPVLFPTDEVMKKKMDECSRLHRFQQNGVSNPMNLEPRESIFYRTSREGLGWKPGGRFDFHPTSQSRIKEMQEREVRRSEERRQDSLMLHQNEVEFLASRESQRNKAPIDVEYWRMMDEADRATRRTREEFRRLASIEFRDMERGHPDVVRRALAEVNWSRAENAAAEPEPLAGPVVATTFDPRADLHQAEVDLFEWYESFSDVERQDRNINAIRVQRLKAISMLKSQLHSNPRGHWVKSNGGLEY